VREIDGASHNSVDNVRELIESFRALPAPGSKYKIYIIDEVHMLSVSAFNALLKSLEEPPPHTVFILATTEAHKIPDTVISRCQRHELRALTSEQVESRLREIAVAEMMEADEEVFSLIARLSEGSMRDAQSLLDRVHSFCEGKLTTIDAVKVLGVVDRAVLFRLSEAVFRRDPNKVLNDIAAVFSFGIDPNLFLKEFVTHWRELLIAKVGGIDALKSIGVSSLNSAMILDQAASVSLADVQDLSYLARQAADAALRSAFPKIAFEALLVRMATRQPVRDIASLLEELRATKGGTHSGGGKEPGTGSVKSLPQKSQSGEGNGPKIVRHTTLGTTGAAAQAIEVQSVPVQEPKIEPPTLRWEAFVLELKGGGILTEQLKRLSIDQFAPGVLKARGPEFSVGYLQQKANREKLESALTHFCPGEHSWNISLSIAGADGASILHKQRTQEQQYRDEKTKDLSSHPNIQSLQKAFPGSTIENIRLKEE